MNVNGFNVTGLMERKSGIMDTEPGQHTPSRIAQAAAALSLVGHAKARAELLNEALMACAQLCFERDTDGSYPNVDVDGRILFPVPWGRAGRVVWGLRRTEADVLRLLLMDRMTPVQGRAVPLYIWDGNTRSWFVNRNDYATVKASLDYLAQYPVTAKLFRRYSDLVRDASKR